MKFAPIKLSYDPERSKGTLEILETVTVEDREEPVGDTSISFPLSDEACDKIKAVILDEQRRALDEISA